MSKKKPTSEQPKKEPRRKTPTFLLELPLAVYAGQAKRIRGHLEAGRAFYNALLSEGQSRLGRMRADPGQTRPRPGGPRHSPHPEARAQRRLCGLTGAVR